MGEPFSNLQPSLGINFLIQAQGVDPASGSGAASGYTVGFVYEYAFNYPAMGGIELDGQTLTTADYAQLAAVLGQSKSTSFTLPNIGTQAIIGAGAGYTIDQPVGSANTTLTQANLPAADGGSDAPFSNVQPSLPLQTLICIDGSGDALVGELANYAGTNIPAGWALADGSTLSIAANQALYDVIGTTYGGSGGTFNLPDLQGRLMVGADTADPLGTYFGQATTTLAPGNLPAGGDTPISNDQPSLSINYLIATSTNDVYPTHDPGAPSNDGTPTLGQIIAYAGSSIPQGWSLADGALINILSNTALFSLLGTNYGGNGMQVFGLPDLQGYTPTGSGTAPVGYGYMDGSDTTTLTTDEALCYLRGTHIRIQGGDVPVENLRIGDQVFTLSRGMQPIRWIGTGKLMVPAGRRSPATPVIVRADALEPGVPKRDLYLTKGHALYLQGAFVPVEFLVNHRSIVWDDAAREVEFYHIELNSHEVMLAEGAPAESYRDEGNRWMFANAHPAWDRPGVAPHAPVLTGGAKLDAIWRRLLDRSGQRLRLPTTQDPDLHLLVNGERVEATCTDGKVHVFDIRATRHPIVIASRAAAQDELGRCRDPRRLGVAISQVVICNQVFTAAELAHRPGFHAYEEAEASTWTDGHAILPAVIVGAPCRVHVHVRHTTHYAADACKRAA